MPGSQSSARPFDLARCFNEALEIFRKNAFVLIATAIVYDLLSLGTLLVLCGPLTAGVALLSLKAVTHPSQPIKIGDLFRGIHRFTSYLGLFLVVTVTVLIGIVLGILPGVLVATFWLYAFFFMLEMNLGVVDSICASARLVMRRGFIMNLLLNAVLIGLAV